MQYANTYYGGGSWGECIGLNRDLLRENVHASVRFFCGVISLNNLAQSLFKIFTVSEIKECFFPGSGQGFNEDRPRLWERSLRGDDVNSYVA